MKKLRIIFTLFVVNTIYANAPIEPVAGKVSYISSQHIYVQFENTNGIKENDTLFIKVNESFVPTLIVKYLSSRSCACSAIQSISLQQGDEILARLNSGSFPVKEQLSTQSKETTLQSNQSITNNLSSSNPPVKNEVEQNRMQNNFLQGRFSVQSNSNFSNSLYSRDYQYWRYVISLDGQRINGSNLSFKTYFNFNYKADEWNLVKNSLGRNFRIYDFTAKYDFVGGSFIKAGRFIDFRLSSIGAMDGVQAEIKWSKYFSGITFGSRPGLTDYGFDFKLFQVGGYFGRTDSTSNVMMENVVSIFHQTNNFVTDRRFLFLQHSSNVLNKLNFYATSEFELYEKEGNVAKNSFKLSSFYIMSRYSPARWISASVSYDARKRIIYYETYKNFDQSFMNDNLRHGLRLTISLRPTNYFSVGLNSGYRYQKDDPKPARNFGGYLSYYSIPYLFMSSTINFSRTISSYSEGDNYGISFYKDIASGLISLSAAYRKSLYNYVLSSFKSEQNIFTLDCSIRFSRSIYSSISYEGIFDKNQTYGRISIDLTGRLY